MPNGDGGHSIEEHLENLLSRKRILEEDNQRLREENLALQRKLDASLIVLKLLRERRSNVDKRKRIPQTKT
jgi:hypothetical protein